MSVQELLLLLLLHLRVNGTTKFRVPSWRDAMNSHFKYYNPRLLCAEAPDSGELGNIWAILGFVFGLLSAKKATAVART